MTLYYSGYANDIARIRREGFTDPEPAADRHQHPLVGIRLIDQEPKQDRLSASIELQVDESTALPYEVTEPGYVPRTFCVPAWILNAIVLNRAEG